MGRFLGINYGKDKTPPSGAVQSTTPGTPPDYPSKVFIDKTADGYFESSTEPPGHMARIMDALYGFYGHTSFVELFYCLPEVFAPIHEIASRVADANWQLLKDWNDEVDFNDADFNKLFSQPNVLQSHWELVYMSVVYEILTGGQFWNFNRVSSNLLVTPDGEEYKNIVGWFNMAAHRVYAKMNRNVNPYTTTAISDFVQVWEESNSMEGGKRQFQPENVVPVLHLSLDRPFDLNCRKAMILGAEKAIKNLIPVYEARGIIYIKRGALGFVVSRKSDESGLQSLKPSEKEQAIKDFQGTYGVTKEKEPISITSLPVDFIRTAMSIQELQPFDETLADATAIYAVLRVPPHLIPRKDHSTFANANEDMKAFYENVIIPWAEKYAKIWTNYFKIPRRYIKPDYSHVGVLQENRKTEADVAQVMGNVWYQRWTSGVCCLNDWITAIEGEPVKGNPMFELKIFEMDEKQLELVKKYVNLKAPKQDKNQQTNKKQKDGNNKKP